MARIHFGHCIGCDQPIRPPFLSFAVEQSTGDGNRVTQWEAVDVCGVCALRLTAEELFHLVSTEDGEAEQPQLAEAQS
jgi:hypothetical protein